MSSLSGYFGRLVGAIQAIVPSRAMGRVVKARDSQAVVEGLAAPLGSSVLITRLDGSTVEAEVIAIDCDRCSLELLGESEGVRAGSAAELRGVEPTIGASDKMFGRTLDWNCEPVDGMGPISGLVPVAVSRRSNRAGRVAGRTPMPLKHAPDMFKGAKAALTSPWPDASIELADMARSHNGPIVAALIGGSMLEHSLFSADLREAFYRTVVVSEPGEKQAFRALRSLRSAMALASYFSVGADVLLVVGWHLHGQPSISDSTAPYGVTSIWSIEQESPGFDLVVGRQTDTRRAA